MAVPEFFRFIRPALELLADGQNHHSRDVERILADHLQLSQEDRDELIPSKRQTRLYNRVTWALTYLRQAKLVESVGRGVNRITPRGLKYLKTCPEVIKPVDLEVFPEFAAFHNANGSTSRVSKSTGTSTEADLADSVSDKATPEEAIAAAYTALNEALAQDLLERVKAMPPAFFEQLVVQLMLRLGYGGTADDAGQTLGKSGDGGVDGVINQDKLGLEKIYLQAKRWDNGTVGRKEVQAFVGALNGQGASKGVFMTTSTFTKEAKEYARYNLNFKISLVDGVELARLMIEHDLGISLVQRYDVKRVDSDFFSEA